jgi:hypothetical protein
MPSKPFQSRFIALLRSFLGVPRRYAGLQLTSSNRGYPCSRRSLTECVDKMTVPSWREPKSRPLWMSSRGASLTLAIVNEVDPLLSASCSSIEPHDITTSENLLPNRQVGAVRRRMKGTRPPPVRGKLLLRQTLRHSMVHSIVN